MVLFILSLPFGLNSALSFGPVDLVQILAAGAVFLVMTLRLASGRTPLVWHPGASWVVVLWALTLLSTVAARDQGVALSQTIAFGVAGFLALAVQSACTHPVHLRRLVLAMTLMGAGVCLYSLGDVGALQSSGEAGAVSDRPTGIFAQANEMGTFSVLLLFVGMGLSLGAHTRLERIVGVLCVVVSTMALVATLSRGAWIGALIALFVLLLLTPALRRPLAAVLLGVILIGSPVLARAAPGVWELAGQRLSTITEPESNPEDARDLIWQEGRRQMLERPLTGQGPGNYVIASQGTATASPGVNALHAHNLLLNVAAEVGLPAVAVLLAWVGSLTRSVHRARKRLSGPDAGLLTALACALVALGGQGLVDFTFRNPILLVSTWTVIGLLLAGIRLAGSSPQQSGGAASPYRPGSHGPPRAVT